jgi:hypothetical protein
MSLDKRPSLTAEEIFVRPCRQCTRPTASVLQTVASET